MNYATIAQSTNFRLQNIDLKIKIFQKFYKSMELKLTQYLP